MLDVSQAHEHHLGILPPPWVKQGIKLLPPVRNSEWFGGQMGKRVQVSQSAEEYRGMLCWAYQRVPDIYPSSTQCLERTKRWKRIENTEKKTKKTTRVSFKSVSVL